jgi:hypothetical protein
VFPPVHDYNPELDYLGVVSLGMAIDPILPGKTIGTNPSSDSRENISSFVIIVPGIIRTGTFSMMICEGNPVGNSREIHQQ